MKRNIYAQLKSMITDSESREVLIIEGARQVGKSYLVNDVLKNVNIPKLSFDLEKNNKFRHMLNKTDDFEDFKTLLHDQYNLQSDSILFIDEAQESPKLATYVKSFKEDWPEVRVILTGSSMNRFFSKETRVPVGRTKSLCVYPFTFNEFLKFTGHDDLSNFISEAPEKVSQSRHDLLLQHFDSYLQVGGYPEAVKAYKRGKEYTVVIDEILATLEEDFARKEAYEPELFDNVVRAVSNHIGSLSKYSHIDSTKYKAKLAVESMIAWHIILEVQPYSLDPHRSNFLPKRYLHDVGIINRKRSLAAPKISLVNTIDERLRTPLGGLFENAVLLNILEGSSAYKTVSTWKKGNNIDMEVDFLMESNKLGLKIPIECKASLNLKKKHYHNVIQYLKLTNQKLGVVISAAPLEKISIDDGYTIVNIPIYLASRNNIEIYLLNL